MSTTTATAPRVLASDSGTTIKHKAREREQIQLLLADFRARGGKVQVLGTTPLRKSLTRRQMIERRVEKT